MVPDAEFGYELLVCRWAELAWRPDGDPTPVIVGRQIGTRNRRWDTLVIEVDPDGLRRRRAFGDRELDRDLLKVVRHAPADWQWYRDALPEPGYPWRYVREAIHRAAARDLLDERKRRGRIEIRRKRPYPDWIRRIVAIENKPDLTASAAAALADQLAYDVETELLDETWLATEATGDHIEPALLQEMPVEAGIVVTAFGDGVGPETARVEWLPSDLRTNAAADSGEPVDADTGIRRTVIAERAYGRGWRSYHDTMRPDCRHFRLERNGQALLPDCAAKGRCPTARECSGSCAEFSPEPPQWRTKSWPIDGGPGRGIQWLLERRRNRVRYRTARRES